MSTTFPLDGKRLRFAGATDVGRKRDHNEDFMALPAEQRLAIVADGMGGHASGEVASALAVETIVDYYKNTAELQPITWPYKVDHDLRADINRMNIAILLANTEIFEKANREVSCKGMGTTVVATYFVDDNLIVGHVGDSRAYRLRNGKLTQLTEDHSLVNNWLKTKSKTLEEIENPANKKMKNVLLRALGNRNNVQVDVLHETPKTGDCYLLCSDGLCGMITDDQIAAILGNEPDLDKAVETLIQAANDAGGEDNITAILARVEAI